TRGFAGLGSRPWVWKDPRLCSTLPFWLSLAQAEPRFVVATRHPLDVAVSLVKRDGCPLDVALALWERSARALIGGLEGRAVFIVPHETLLGDPEATVASLASWVGTDVTGDPIEAAASVEARTGPVSQPDPGRLSPEQSVLWDCIDHPVGEARLVAKPPPESPSTAGLLGSASLTQRLATLARSHVRLRRHRG
ncbi:MAG: hypothetical protein GY773_31355, partial [Actinomycetia bacterium]|nr:hypothetical protein [Actinomycetes bacterium]